VADLKNPEDLALVRDLALAADVIVENFRPGVMERLGLGYETLSAANPRLVFASLSGLGATGPQAQRGAFDIIVQAEFGYMSITGEKGGKAIKQGTSIFDLACGIYCFGGIMTALFQRERSGKGQKVETSLMEAEVSFLVDAAMEYFLTGKSRARWGSEHSNIVPYKVFSTLDGELVIGAGYQNLFEAFVRAIGQEHLITDARFETHTKRIRNREALYPLLDEVVSRWTTRELYALLSQADVPCAPINDMEKVFEHPQVLHRNMRVSVADADGTPFPLIGPAVKYSSFDITSGWTAPPRANAHAAEVARDWVESRAAS
jgi:succinate--hydroxymethylglutarate CoA-transferase